MCVNEREKERNIYREMDRKKDQFTDEDMEVKQASKKSLMMDRRSSQLAKVLRVVNVATI